LTYKKSNDAWELKVKMTDSDVMWDLYIALGCRGTLESMRKYPSDGDNSKPHQTWRANKRDLIFEICTELYPYMGNRRRERFQEFFNWYQNKTK
jgi:hypothetical protein